MGEVLPVSMAELRRVMKQSTRSSLRCQQLPTSTSIVQAGRRARTTGQNPARSGPVGSAHRGDVRVTRHIWSQRKRKLQLKVCEATGQEESALHHKHCLLFHLNLLRGPRVHVAPSSP